MTWGDDGKLGRQARQQNLQRRAAELFFDDNTVEGVLLASSIFICLGGIMLASGRFVNRSDIIAQRDFISYMIILCVVLTMLYIALVVVAEIFPAITVRSCTKCFSLLQHGKPENHETLDLDADLTVASNPMIQAGFTSGDKTLRSDLETTNKERECPFSPGRGAQARAREATERVQEVAFSNPLLGNKNELQQIKARKTVTGSRSARRVESGAPRAGRSCGCEHRWARMPCGVRRARL